MEASPALEKVIKPSTVVVIVAATVVVILALGIVIGNLFFWNAYDKDTKLEHDFKLAKATVNSEPNNVSARIALGWVFLQRGELDKAKEQYQNALELEPKSPIARYNMALVKIALKDMAGARTDLEALKNEDPTYFEVRRTLGIHYREIGELLLSKQELELVNNMQPGNLITMHELGLTYEKLGETAKAKAMYELALKYNPADQIVQEALKSLNQGSPK